MKKQHKAAVICASGIGDGLLMMIAANNLERAGYQVDVFHQAKEKLRTLFPTKFHWKVFEDSPLEDYSIIILQNDHGKVAWELLNRRKNGKLDQLIVFAPKKSPALTSADYLFNPKISIVKNIFQAMQRILPQQSITQENAIIMPEGIFRKNSRQVIIHPTTNHHVKNWPPHYFFSLAQRLKKAGFVPVFCLSPDEKELWEKLCCHHFSLLAVSDLNELAKALYQCGFFVGNDSGIGHFASNLGIPTVTIASNRRIAKLWQPDWTVNALACYSVPLPNFKGINFRLREWSWPIFLSVGKVLKTFNALTRMQKYG